MILVLVGFLVRLVFLGSLAFLAMAMIVELVELVMGKCWLVPS